MSSKRFLKDGLGSRMKYFENVRKEYLPTKLPVIIRIDGRAFHTFTKGFDRPFDNIFIQAMQKTAEVLCREISGCKLAYTQSDEISLLVTDYDRPEQQAWFGNNLQKLVSVSASIATAAFNKVFYEINRNFGVEIIADAFVQSDNVDKEAFNRFYTYSDKFFTATFDSRAFAIPKDEVCNYFIWRQQDAIRNSILMTAQSILPLREMHKKSCVELKEILADRTVIWDDFAPVLRHGSCAVYEEYMNNETPRHRWITDQNIPVFTQDRTYINRYVYTPEEIEKMKQESST